MTSLSIYVYLLEPYTRIPILLPLKMQIPANNKRPCVEIFAVSFCQSGKKARVFWKFTLSDVVHLRHNAKDFGSVPNLATSEGWIRNAQIHEMRKAYPQRTEWQKPT